MRNSSSADRQHAGFTIVELIVSITIIGLLVALILPGVQSAREASRRATCQNHLHQFGVAIQAFESTHGEYPYNAGPRIFRPSSFNPNLSLWRLSGYSIHAQLLSYLDFGNIANQLDFGRNVSGQHDARIMESQSIAKVIPVFQCPSEGAEWGTSYRACMSDGPASAGLPGRGGVFRRTSAKRVTDITDGTSNTAMMSEKLHGAGVPGQFDQHRDIWYCGVRPLLTAPYLDIPADEMVSYCEISNTLPTSSYPFSGYDWMTYGGEYTAYNHVAAPNSPTPDCSGEPAQPFVQGISYSGSTDNVGSFRATSFHPGGVQVLYADGSVRIVGNSVDINLWRAMASINKGD